MGRKGDFGLFIAHGGYILLELRVWERFLHNRMAGEG